MAADPIERENVWAMALGSIVPGVGLLATPICVILAIVCFDERDIYDAWAGAVFIMTLPLLSLVSLAGGWTLLWLKRPGPAQVMIVAPPLAWVAVALMLWLIPHGHSVH